MTGICPTCGAVIELMQSDNLTLGYCDCNNAGRRVVINFVTPKPPEAPKVVLPKGKK